MINSVSDEVRNGWLNVTRQAWRFVGLFTEEPRMFEDTAEVTGSYARQEVSWSEPLNNGVIYNTNFLYFGGIDFGLRVTHIGVFTDKTSNTMGFYGELAKPTVISRGAIEKKENDDDYRRLGLGELWLPEKAVTIRIA